MNRYSGQHQDELSLEPGDLVKYHDTMIVVIVNHNYMNHHDNVDHDDCDEGAASRRAGEGLVARTKTTSATSGLCIVQPL